MRTTRWLVVVAFGAAIAIACQNSRSPVAPDTTPANTQPGDGTAGALTGPGGGGTGGPTGGGTGGTPTPTPSPAICPGSRVQSFTGADLLTTLCADPVLCPFPNLTPPLGGSTARATAQVLYTDNCTITDLTVTFSARIVDDPQIVAPGPGNLSADGVSARWTWANITGSPNFIDLISASTGVVNGNRLGTFESCDVQLSDSFSSSFPTGGAPYPGQYAPVDPINPHLLALVPEAPANSDIVLNLGPQGSTNGDILLIDCIGIVATLVQM